MEKNFGAQTELVNYGDPKICKMNSYVDTYVEELYQKNDDLSESNAQIVNLKLQIMYASVFYCFPSLKMRLVMMVTIPGWSSSMFCTLKAIGSNSLILTWRKTARFFLVRKRAKWMWVIIMRLTSTFRTGKIASLDAQFVELPFKVNIIIEIAIFSSTSKNYYLINIYIFKGTKTQHGHHIAQQSWWSSESGTKNF